MRRVIGLALGAGLSLSGSAMAQTPAPTPAPTAAPAAAPAPAPAAAPAAPAAAPATTGTVPRVVGGVGPFWDGIRKGDAAYAARDFEGSIAAYREAIEKEAKNPMGHYRLGEAQIAKGDLGEAEQSWQTGLRFAGRDERMRSKLLFRLADLRERQKNYDEADGRWKEYGQHAQSQPEGKGFAGTATERQKRIAEWKQIMADSALVKERIEKRVKEADESMRKSSK